ncbi:hypothetical protein MKW94_000380 [Papaver nudicaule]|uniref:S-protein homolog n=1 Tax=Papaver nudicaule TaxID=74823 RepID=A0AA41RWC9_PAPNU|nr:hypothetical protein [Papaver nudicaule]
MACFFINGYNRIPVFAKFFFVVVTILFAFLSVTDGYGWWNLRTQVVVSNGLSPNTTLTFHCKSADDDLGEHKLPFEYIWSWWFYNNFWDTTLYWCNFWWEENGKHRQEGYQIYKTRRDYKRCGYYCRSSIRSDGVYGFTPKMKPYLKYKWP